MNIRFRHMRAFLAIVDSGSASKAARELGMTQSSVSKLLKSFETEVGFALFARIGRHLKLTDQGRVFLPRVRNAYRSLDDVRKLAEDLKDNQGKRLRLCAIGPIAHTGHLTRALGRFSRRYPDDVVSLDTKSRIEIDNWVRQDHADLGFTLLPSDHTELASRVMVETEAIGVVPAQHRFAGRQYLRPEDLANEPLVLPHSTARVRLLLEAAFLDAGLRLRPRFEATSATTAAQMVSEGLGVSVLDPYSVQSVPAANIAIIPWRPKMKLTYGMIMQKDRVLTSREEDLFGYLKKSLKQLG